MVRSVPRRRTIRVAPQPGVPSEDTSAELRTSRCVKYTMFFKNMFFLLCGVLLGAIGFVALKEKNKLDGKLNSLFLDPAAIILTIGVVVFIISFCGALGALRENKCLLRFFYICIILILITEIALAIVLYAYRDKAREKVDGIFRELIVDYHEDADLQAIVDYVQEGLGCCGSRDAKDWEYNPYFNCSNVRKIVSACSVPHSCCKVDKINRLCGGGVLLLKVDERQEKVFTLGCVEALEKWIMDRIVYAGVAAGCLVVLQLVAVRLAFRMISDINYIIKWRETHP